MGQNVYAPPAMQKPKSSYKGCVIGCLVTLVIACIAGGALLFVIYSQLSSMMDAVLDDAPVEITSMESSQEEQDAALENFEVFVAAAAAGEQQTIELSGRDLNLLIRAKAEESDLDVGDYVYLDIQDSELSGEISFPLAEIMPENGFLANKYINGQATFSMGMENDRLSIYIEELVVKGEAVPEQIMDELRTENIAKDFNNDPDMREWMQYVESIEIIGDKAVITSKGTQP